MVAMTISSTRDAYVELIGLALALLALTLPYATLVTLLTTALLGDWEFLPEVLGLSFSLHGAMPATGAWTSARFPYPIPQEGYKNVAPGQAGLAWISVFGGMAGSALLCRPVIALAVWVNVAEGGDAWAWATLPVGTAYGAGLTALGLRPASPRTAARLHGCTAAGDPGGGRRRVLQARARGARRAGSQGRTRSATRPARSPTTGAPAGRSSTSGRRRPSKV